ncbi:hypothetical protein HALO32_00657 [Halomonas lysinitropha]|uniref:Uncharacterized protein n=1 Tax=Halomonas lysinitropha TaxID=2607506 RepID=A0A5K1HYI3_9GAMM|nr:hypothetical protein HALO32_00657 [Halomonas lysinitropha]
MALLIFPAALTSIALSPMSIVQDVKVQLSLRPKPLNSTASVFPPLTITLPLVDEKVLKTSAPYITSIFHPPESLLISALTTFLLLTASLLAKCKPVNTLLYSAAKRLLAIIELKLGTAMVAIMTMTAIVTSSSIKVKPQDLLLPAFIDFIIGPLFTSLIKSKAWARCVIILRRTGRGRSGNTIASRRCIGCDTIIIFR